MISLPSRIAGPLLDRRIGQHPPMPAGATLTVVAPATNPLRFTDSTLPWRATREGRTRTCWIRPAQIVAALKEFESALEELADPEIPVLLKSLFSAAGRLPAAGDQPGVWAELSLGLERLVARVERASLPVGTGMARIDFISRSMVSLEQVCRFSWGKLSMQMLIGQMAHDLARRAASNPGLQDTITERASAEFATPLPFFSAGLEWTRQRTTSINDEGHLVSASSYQLALQCRLSAWLAGIRASAGALTGRGTYCRDAREHARHFYFELVADYRHLPALAGCFSRAASIGQSGPRKDELHDFEAQQDAFLLQQPDHAQLLSLLIGRSGAGRVLLGAAGENPVRPVQTRFSTGSASASAELGIGPVKAGVFADLSTKRTVSTRHRTLCELMTDPKLPALQRAALRAQLEQATAPLMQRLASFWALPGAIDPHDSDQIEPALKHLWQDLAFYRDLHARKVVGARGADAAVRALHTKYGARDSAACLRTMALVLGELSARASQIGERGRAEQLGKQLWALERFLFDSGIPGARAQLAERAVASQQFLQSSTEYNLELRASVESPGSLGTASGSARINFRRLEHHDPLAAGDYVTIEFSLGANETANQNTLNNITRALQHSQPLAMQPFAKAAFTKQGLYTVRLFRPSQIAGQPFSLQYQRRMTLQTSQFGAEIPLHLPGMASLTLAGSHSRSQTGFAGESSGIDSMLYFARAFLHARHTRKMDQNGVVHQSSYWNQLERNNSDALEQLFLGYAAEYDKPGRRVAELLALEQTLELDASGMAKATLVRQQLLEAAMLLGQHRSLAHYRACLDQFRDLLNVYFDYWVKKRESSPAYQVWQICC